MLHMDNGEIRKQDIHLETNSTKQMPVWLRKNRFTLYNKIESELVWLRKKYNDFISTEKTNLKLNIVTTTDLTKTIKACYKMIISYFDQT